MGAFELISSRTFGKELGGKRTAEMVFRVDAPPDVALNDPGLPKEGVTTFVSDPSLLCDRLSASYFQGSDAQALVTAYFSSDRSWRAAPHIDKLQPGYLEFESDFLEAAEQLPVQVFTPGGMKYSQIQPDGKVADKVIDTWDLQRINAVNYQMAFQVQVVLQTYTMTDASSINKQNGKLHFISGEWYRFKAGKVRRRDSAKYETVYTWSSDPGVPLLPDGKDENGNFVVLSPGPFQSVLGISPPDGGGGPFSGWSRPPFEVVQVQVNNTINQQQGSQNRHKFYTFCPHTQIPNGFKSLPGNPL